MFIERLKTFLLNGTSKLRSIYMKALCELVEHMPLTKALEIEDIAAQKNFATVNDILLIAEN